MGKKFENLDTKYQPKTVDEIAGQPYIKEHLKIIAQSGDMPHLLFHGPPGTGKTSAAIALARDIFGTEWRYNLSRFNASNDRGIGFIRGEIHGLVKTTPVEAAYHFIFLDEADYLTDEAQAALRDIMQTNTGTVKFILACNDIKRILKAIQDRCKILAFRPLSQTVIVDRLRVICDNERISYEVNALEAVAKMSGGSLRKAIHDINFCYDSKRHISKSAVQEFSEIDERDMKLLFDSVLANDTSGCAMRLNGLYEGGNSAINIFSEIIKMIDNNPSINEATKQDMIDQTGQYEWRISQGADEQLQMRCYVNSLVRVVDSHKHSDGMIISHVETCSKLPE